MCLTIHSGPQNRNLGCLQQSAKYLRRATKGGKKFLKTIYRNTEVPKNGWILREKPLDWSIKALEDERGLHGECVHAYAKHTDDVRRSWPDGYEGTEFKSYSVGILAYGGWSYHYGPFSTKLNGEDHVGSLALYVSDGPTKMSKALDHVLTLSESKRWRALLKVVPAKVVNLLNNEYSDIEW